MEAVLCDRDALDFWRTRSEPLIGTANPLASLPTRRAVPDIGAPTASLLADIKSWGLSHFEDVHLMVSSSADRRSLKGAVYLLHSGTVPARSFARAAGQVYVVCPELLFIQMAQKLSLVELLELGYELCGTYRMTRERPTYGVEPLTSVSKLKAYIQRAEGVRGRKIARCAVQWIADGSASPAETALAIVFKLPYRKGGFGLGGFVMNPELELNEEAARILGRDTIRPDLYWAEARHPAEYDSPLFHSSREQAEYDERRRNAYDAMGMGVSIFKSRHLCSDDLMDAMAQGVRRHVGARQNRLPADYEAEHRRLLAEVFRYWRDICEQGVDRVTAEEMVARYADPFDML